MSFKMKGFNEFTKELNRVKEKAQKLNGEHTVSLGVLFNDSFMSEYTSFNSFEEMLNKSGYKVETPEDFKNIPDKEWDEYVKSNTNFNSWEEMQQEAVTRHIVSELGF